VEGRDMHYSMLIRWEPQDGIYVVTVPELPGCVTHGATYEEAVRQGMDAIDTWVMGEDPATLPAPNYYPLDDPAEERAEPDKQAGAARGG
jgi:predicted RNase H-like HicB family nuclease